MSMNVRILLIAVCVYVLVAIVKKRVKSEESLYSILQILSVNAFEKVPMAELLTEIASQFGDGDSCNQLILNY